jgi:hypothetical protein
MQESSVMDDESKQPATAAQIRRMVRDVDDAVVSSIERTGASAAEVLQAVQWLRGGGGLEDEAGHEPHGAVKAVYEILQAEEPEETP